MTTIATEGGRFYLPNGEPFAEVPNKSKPSESRAATIRDALKVGAEPSVSTVLKAAAAPGLIKYFVNSALDSALTLPRLEGESLDDFKARALLDSQEQGKKARDRGTEIHTAIERYIRGEAYEEVYGPHVRTVAKTLGMGGIDIQTCSPERSFCLPGQYGGKVDLFSITDNYVLDFKGIDDAKLEGKLGYDEHIRQLAAYANGLHLHKPRLINVFIARQSGAVRLKEWTQEEADHALAEFLALLRFYRLSNGFPVPAQPESAA